MTIRFCLWCVPGSLANHNAGALQTGNQMFNTLESSEKSKKLNFAKSLPADISVQLLVEVFHVSIEVQHLVLEGEAVIFLPPLVTQVSVAIQHCLLVFQFNVSFVFWLVGLPDLSSPFLFEN